MRPTTTTTLALFLSLALLGGPALADIPRRIVPLDGLWVGGEEGYQSRVVSLRFEGSFMVFTDHGSVAFVSWAPAGRESAVGGRHRLAADFTINTVTSLKGKPVQVSPNERVAKGLMRWEKGALRVCASEPGKPLRATLAPRGAQKPAANVRCFDLTKVVVGARGGAKAFNQCVMGCVRQNQMRAVGPDVIEADCRKECGK